MHVKDLKDFWKFNLRPSYILPQFLFKHWPSILIDRSQHALTERKEHSYFIIPWTEQMKKKRKLILVSE